MGLYSKYVLPRVITLGMGNSELQPYRARLVSRAGGRVLEVGIGPGINLPLYSASVLEIVGLEPSPQLRAIAARAARQARVPVSLVAGSAEQMPVDDRSVDTVVTSWTLCSVTNAAGALREMRRVLKPDGQLLFVEHGQAPEESVRRWQDRLTPVWKRIGGGCHLNRPIRSLIENAGFAVAQIETGYMKGPRWLTFMYEGRATPLAA
jgi:ubiquinone/menaquinone biosynthesis C-methylase UbiE